MKLNLKCQSYQHSRGQNFSYMLMFILKTMLCNLEEVDQTKTSNLSVLLDEM